MERVKQTHDLPSFVARKEVVLVSVDNSEISVVEGKDLGNLNSCILASEGNGSEQEGIRKTKYGHNGSARVESLVKGVKRKSLETCDQSIEIRRNASSVTHQRSDDNAEGSRSRAPDGDRRRSGRRVDGSSGSEKRKKLESSIISRTEYCGSGGAREHDVNRHKMCRVGKLRTDHRVQSSASPSEEKKSKVKSFQVEVRQKGQDFERLKRKPEASLVSVLNGPTVVQITRDGDGVNRMNGQHSQGYTREDRAGPVRRTRSEVRQSTRSSCKFEKAVLVRVDTFGRDDLKRGRDHELRSVVDSKRRRNEPNRDREEVDKEREHRLKYVVREKKHLSEYCETRGDGKRVRDRMKGLNAGEVQGESRQVDTVFSEEERHAESRRHARDLRQGQQLENGNNAAVRSEVPLTNKHRGTGHSQFHRTQSQKYGFFNTEFEFKGNSLREIHRQQTRGPTFGSNEAHRRDGQDVHKAAVRKPGRSLESDINFIRDYRRIDEMDMKERSVLKERCIDEGLLLCSQESVDQECSNPGIIVTKENVDHISREIKGLRPAIIDIDVARHELAVQIGKTHGVQSLTTMSSKVVAPILDLKQKSVGECMDEPGVRVTNASEDGERQEMGLEGNGRKEDQKQNSHVKSVPASENVKSFVQEDSVGVSEVDRVGEIFNRPDIAKEDLLRQSESGPAPPDNSKRDHKRKRSRRTEASNWSKKPRDKGACIEERLTANEVQEVKSSLDKQGGDDFNRDRTDKCQSVDGKRDVQDRPRTEDMASAKSVEAHQVKPAKDISVKKEKPYESSLKRQTVKVDRVRDGDSTDLPSREHIYIHRKHRHSSHSVSPTRQRRRHSPNHKGLCKSTSPHRYEKDCVDWEKFEKERINTLAAFDSRYRRFGGGTSGLGGYSPRRRRSEAAIKTPSPPPRSPERRKPRAWDLPPPGMDSSMVAAISAAHQAAVQQAVVALATVAPLVPSSVMVPPVATPASVSNGMTTLPAIIPSLLQQVNPAVTAVTLTQATRPLRRLYVGNVPATVSDGELLEFMNAAMLSANANHLPGTKPCINCSVNVEKSYAFAEFITPEDATAALAFDGVTLHGTTLKIRRPKDFVPQANGGTENASPVLDMVSSSVRDSPHKVFVGGISSSLSADKVKEIVTAFGQLKAYHWEVDRQKKPPQAFAFLEYMDPAATLKACAGLNGMRLGTGFLTVVQATPDADSEIVTLNAPFYGIPEHAKTLLEPATCVLELQNLVTQEEVQKMSKEETEALIEDVRLECTRFGNVKSTHIVQHFKLERDYGPGLCDIECIASKAVMGENCECMSVPGSVHEEVIGEDTEGELSVAVQTETSSSLVRGQDQRFCEGSATDEQIRDTYIGSDQQFSSEGNKEKSCNERDCSTNELRGEVPESGSQLPVLGEINEDWHRNMTTRQSETSISSGRMDDTEQNNYGGLGLSSSSLKEELDASTREWEILHLGRVYVEFSREESACQAAHFIHGRKFSGRKVTVCFFPLKLYQKRFHKGLGPRTLEEKQALALAVQGHLTAHIKD